MKDLKELEVEEQRIYLKKSFGKWRTVNPIKTEGKINWKNLLIGGSWWNIIIVGLIVLGIIMMTSEYASKVTMLQECLNKTVPIILP